MYTLVTESDIEDLFRIFRERVVIDRPAPFSLTFAVRKLHPWNFTQKAFRRRLVELLKQRLPVTVNWAIVEYLP